MRTEAPLLAPIFRSDGQARLLSALMLDDEERNLTQLAEQTGLAYPTVHREAARLLQAGILVERQVGRTRLLRADPNSPLFTPLREILLITTGPVVLLKEEFCRIQGVESAFLHGSFAARMRGIDGPAPNDIDVLIIGTPDPDEVYDACGRVEEIVHRPVNPTIATRAEFDRDSGFHTQVRNSSTVPVLGELPWP
ncbi:helix-turn-helix domain-containing protein [Brachybacterium tyrofermentans]|uniref:helix-turn-helix domain-containing protein n=1 Tax=Brachybacterium tyrofermentans TaxID=47848 RepID=UPI003F91378C